MSFVEAGPIRQFPELNAIYCAIIYRADVVAFEDKSQHPVRKFKGGTLYAVDYKGIRYVEQNQNTSSAYAKRATAGAKIIWVIRLRDNEYLGYIEDGIVHMKPKAKSA